MSDQDERGTIKTRSGTWDWELKTFRSWPKSNPTGMRLGFEDPANSVNTMSLRLDPDDAEFSEKCIRRLSLLPRKRRFEDDSGNVWIAHPVGEGRTEVGKSVVRISLHSLEQRSKMADLPPGRTLGDLKNKELVDLI